MTAKEFWEAIKWSNQNPDGSVVISPERAKIIDEVVSKNGSN